MSMVQKWFEVYFDARDYFDLADRKKKDKK